MGLSIGSRSSRYFRLLPIFLFALFAITDAGAQATFNITSATYGANAAKSVPAGINGVTLLLSGTLPTAAQQTGTGYLGCFDTGYGSTTGIPLSAPNSDGTEPLTVPASTIQAIPETQFTAANGYSVNAKVYFIAGDESCGGTPNGTISNVYTVPVVAPSLGTYAGPVAVPQTNSAIGIQAAPLTLTIPASGFFPSTATVGTTSIVFDTFGSVAPIPSTSTTAITIPVPSAFSSSVSGTPASLKICNTFGSNTVCTTPTPAITLTVTPLIASAGTIVATPTPVTSAGQTVLTAQFKKAAGASQAANPGAPSGVITFTADGATVPAARLILDTTATFAAQTTAVAAASAPTPTITPAAGSYLGAQTITIADSDPTATIYYTQNGSTPTTGATLYTAPFSISSSQTIEAIAAVAGSANSAIASAAYVVTIRPATHLAFQVQPVNTGLNTAIAPAVQVALLDSTNTVVAGSTAAVTLAIATNPANGVLSGTRTVNAVNGIATFSDLSIAQIGTGYTLRATSGTLTGATSTAFNITPPPITMQVQTTTPAGLVGIGATLNGSFTLGVAAPTGGQVVNLTSGTPGNVTISPASVTVPAGQTVGAFTYTGVAAGSSTLSATSTGYQTGTVVTTATSAQVSLGVVPDVAPGQTQSLALSLATAAPAGGTTVTFTIANTNIATVTQSVFVPAGQFTASTNPQVAGVLIGTTTVTANAPGYAPATRAVNVTVTATFSPATTNINLITSTNTVLNISAPAPAGGIKFNLTSDDPTIATVASSVTVIQGGTTVKVPITGVGDGTTTIRANSTGIAEADGRVTVNSQITENDVVTGYDLQAEVGIYLPVAPSTPTTVTITSNDPTVALISANSTAVGQRTLTFTNITSSYVGSLYVQGKKVGATTLTIAAPGYTSGSEKITVLNTGFVYYGAPNITTTTYSTPTTATLYPVPLNADASVYSFFNTSVSPGSPTISVPVTNSDPTIGTVTSPLVFKAGDTSESYTFTPKGVGTTNLTVGTPPTGFTVPSQYQQITATVSTPAITVSDLNTGVSLQAGLGIYLPVSPPSGVTVTVSIAPSGGVAIAALSKSNTAVGAATQTFTNVTATYVGGVYVQGLRTGSATLTVSAPGYTSGTSTITVTPSGFAYYGVPNFTTTTFSGPNTLTVYPVPLRSTTDLSVYGYSSWTLSPGVGPVTVPITDSATSVGTTSPTSVVFNTNDSSQNYTFQPVAAGTTDLTIGTPSGFATPSQYTKITGTVTAPAISIGGQVTGVHLLRAINVYLPVAPPNPVTVTLTSSTPGVLTLSKDTTTVGTNTVTFTNVSTSYVGTIYVQGQAVGTSTLTESAPGYTSGTSTVETRASGFAFYGAPTFTTTTFSQPTTLTLYTTILDPTSYQIQDYGSGVLNPGVGPVTVALTDSAPAVGTISANTVVYNTGDNYKQITFKPVSAGTANLAIAATPAGFSTPSTSQTGTVTVTAPAITVGDANTGVNFETGLNIGLPQAPPNPVTVTVTSNGPQFALLSKTPTDVGSATLTFNVAAGVTSVGTVYVQGVALGATTLKVSAPGYTDGNSVLTVYDSGFSYYGSPNITTGVSSGSYQIGVYPVLLNHGTLTVLSFFTQYISPLAGTVTVPITSSNQATGTVASPLVFAPGSTGVNAFFTPVANGTSTLTLGTPSPAIGFSTPSQYQTATATVQ